ncbi:hypothetical protein BOO71_0006904 [Deinococcus marmoris]|uniref:Uncharacterized protein n=1 Tax=Deinococcus marmoris TaxID=249408 RepID=A0A1U7NYF3_9DEIO|nr:hypothetical protein BOO71_0006904 [Deinococcus marmoris]
MGVSGRQRHTAPVYRAVNRRKCRHQESRLAAGPCKLVYPAVTRSRAAQHAAAGDTDCD